jgi:hypothetical protein
MNPQTKIILLILFSGMRWAVATPLERIYVSKDGTGFITASGTPFTAWGVNYDHDQSNRLIEEYWVGEWSTVVEDFKEIKELGANAVRIHLQLSAFMDAPDQPNTANLNQLKQLVQLAEETGLYLDLTGLGCYKKQQVPAWYSALNEKERWAVQCRFWQAIAKACSDSNAIFCYDLMNEPIIGGSGDPTDWIPGEFGGFHFVQRLTLDSAGRSQKQIAQAWVKQMTAAIREQDPHHMITVGVIP